MRFALLSAVLVILAGCDQAIDSVSGTQDTTKSLIADHVLTNAQVYSLNWAEPGRDGTPDRSAPYFEESGWRPDATTVAISGNQIIYVGDADGADQFTGANTQRIDLRGATVLPGLVDSHTHIFELGAKLTQVDLTGVETEEEAVALVAARAAQTPKGQWIIGAGWDEGAWATRYPDKALLTAQVPDHPVALDSLHGFAMWVNQAALEAGGITATSQIPVGGEMRLGDDGAPNGLFLNRATTMVDEIIPTTSLETMKSHAVSGLTEMARNGYVAIHDAGDDSAMMDALTALEKTQDLPIRVYAMLSLRDENVMREWIAKGPDSEDGSMLVTRAVKAYYDGALGSRGARLLEDYADKPGHRGVSGGDYGFDQALNAEAIKAGFQVGIHAIGDAGNRESLDIIEAVITDMPAAKSNRHRIEHAQIISPQDMPRFAELGVIASMEPPHAVEDKAWAQDRLGPQRIKGAYAWRTLRENGAQLTFNADLPGSDHNFFYGLHAAVTRQDKNAEPAGGWYPEQAMTIEEALRGYTAWSAYASFREEMTGILAPGRWADITVMDIDPFATAQTAPNDLLKGQILMTIVDGQIVYAAGETAQ